MPLRSSLFGPIYETSALHKSLPPRNATNHQDRDKPQPKCVAQKYQALSQGRVQKKKLEFSNFVGDPPRPPPLKLENIQFFFLHDPQGKFFLLNFSHIRVMKHTISKNQNFQKKILYCLGAGTPSSLATQPTLGGGVVL